MSDNKPRTIVFVHPDLGIGGAERLVVDAAVGLQRNGTRVVIFTSHRDPRHCFDEARDGTLDVRVRGGWLVPRSILGRLTILCAILRQLHLLIHIYLSGELAVLKPTHFFVDQLSAGLPLLQYLSPAAPILFYCHFPDLLLAHGNLPDVASSANDAGRNKPQVSEQKQKQKQKQPLARSRLSAFARLYRKPFDMLEGWSMGFATAIAVNSKFTKSVLESVWPSLAQHSNIHVVYPCVAPGVAEAGSLGSKEDVTAMWPGEKVILSINRFERKKDVGLAIKAFARIPAEKRRNARLIIAGGYDHRVQENKAYHRELEALAESVSLPSQTHKALPSALAASTCPILFLHSVPTASKLLLLRRASLLVYTPSNEHFGIVPLEAMAAGLPVLAASSGGPTETVVDGTTGWLRDTDDPDAWAEAMGRVVGGDMSDADLKKMGCAGAARVRDGFARSAMADCFDEVLQDMGDAKRPPPMPNAVLNLLGILTMFGLGLVTSKLYGAAKGARQL